MERHHRSSGRARLDILAVTIRLALGCMFVWSSLPKIQLPHEFLGDVYAYRLVGPVSGMLVAMILPWLELLVGSCLLGGVLVMGALLGCMAMASMFIVAITWALYQGLGISCGCFGPGTDVIGYGTLARAILIFVVSGLVYLVELFTPREAMPSTRRGVWSGRGAAAPKRTKAEDSLPAAVQASPS